MVSHKSVCGLLRGCRYLPQAPCQLRYTSFKNDKSVKIIDQDLAFYSSSVLETLFFCFVFYLKAANSNI